MKKPANARWKSWRFVCAARGRPDARNGRYHYCMKFESIQIHGSRRDLAGIIDTAWNEHVPWRVSRKQGIEVDRSLAGAFPKERALIEARVEREAGNLASVVDVVTARHHGDNCVLGISAKVFGHTVSPQKGVGGAVQHD